MNEETNCPIGTSDMRPPQTMEYSAKYKVTPIFMHDFEIVLGDLAYVDAAKFLHVIKNNNGIFVTVALNEFIHSLSNLPYKIIAPLMRALSDKENFKKYFELIEK